MVTCGNILLAGDRDSDLKSTTDCLSANGHRCHLAAGSQAALSMVQQGKFDLFVSGLHNESKPDMEVVRALNSMNLGVPVIVLTDNPSLESAAAAVKLSVSAYFFKPVDETEFLSVIDQCVANSQSRRVCADMLERMETWTKDIESLEKYLNSGAGSPNKFDVKNFVPMTIGRILGSVLDLKALLDVVSNKPIDHSMCHLLACPRLNSFEEMIRETIGVLEKTKNYFKSRDLHELRLRLEEFLKAQRS